MSISIIMQTKTDIPTIPEAERSPLVTQLLEIIKQQAVIIQQQGEEIRQIKDEIARLKKQNTKPKIRPSKMDDGSEDEAEDSPNKGKRPGSKKKSKDLKIHDKKQIAPDEIPEGSKFKGFLEFTVQDIKIESHNTCFLLERWQTPTGEYVVGKLPDWVQGKHFAPTLVSYILNQYYHALVTQPLLLQQLRDWDIDISAGQLSRILTEGKEQFHREKDAILDAGLEVSSYVNVDDTGARHVGKNGYCTHIGNEFFAWFQSTDSKSRLNFLTLLRTGPADYVVNEDALQYLRDSAFPKSLLGLLADHAQPVFQNDKAWKDHLKSLGISDKRHVKIATEAATLGSILHHGLSRALVVVSDDAGQFNILNHALCWIHAERLINKLIPFDDKEKLAIEGVRGQIWDLYKALKAYKLEPTKGQKKALDALFDKIMLQETCCDELNAALKRLHRNKAELLLVLDRPEIPLHNNLSERDIREYVKRRKISGSTRSAMGRRCRDTFASLKKTCGKLGVSFWQYLLDRVSGTCLIPPLPELIRQRAGTTG